MHAWCPFLGTKKQRIKVRCYRCRTYIYQEPKFCHGQIFSLGSLSTVEIDRAYWKKKYKTEWKPGKSRVEHVLEVLKKRFPNLTIKPTEYALSEEYIPPNKKHEKHEPDIVVSHDDSVICDIEVTGSYIQMAPPKEIFILRGKYIKARKRKKKDDLDTWFYTVYRGSEYVLDLDLVERFDGNKARELYLKGVPEWYICIPCAEAYPRKTLFKWIEKTI